MVTMVSPLPGKYRTVIEPSIADGEEWCWSVRDADDSILVEGCGEITREGAVTSAEIAMTGLQSMLEILEGTAP